MKTSRIYLVIVLACLLANLSGCRELDPDIEDPTNVPPPQKVITGQEGDSMVVYGSAIYGQYLDGAASFPGNRLEYVVDSALDIKLLMSATSSTNSGDYFYSTNIGLSGSGFLQLSTETIHDSIYQCDQISSITVYNTGSSYACSGIRSYMRPDSIISPIRYPENVVVDENLHWGITNGMLSYRSRYTINSGVPSWEQRGFPLWSRYSSSAYVAFRWRDGSEWKYGYVQLNAGPSSMTVFRIVHEKP